VHPEKQIYRYMKNSLLIIMVMAGLSALSGCSVSSDPAEWSSKRIDKWFEKGDWLNGWQIKPDQSINRKAFAVSYFKNKERWDKAFNFLKSNDLSRLELKRYDIDGDNLYAPVSEYLTKNEEDARYEAHQKYIDVQYVVSGKELIGVAPISNKKDILEPYDVIKDIEYFTVSQGENRLALPDRFFIFFPEDAHRPGLKDGENSPVRKVVVKVKID
jgi:YhcH/YjgK/YiaL family protein